MPVFISYAHHDRDFADRFALQLVREKVHVWFDKWELHAGDSLISRIQQAVSQASALLVVLSKASVASAWCSKELNAGLMRELDERRVVVVPILLEDCTIPLFLREKMYADFRTDFDKGFKTVVESISRVTNEYQARLDAPEFHSDWAIDWGAQANGQFALRLTISEQAKDQPYTCLTTISILCSRDETAKYLERRRREGGNSARRCLVGRLVKLIEDGLDLTVRLSDQFEQVQKLDIATSGLSVLVSSRRLGEDTGRDILLRIGEQIRQIYNHMEQVAHKWAKPRTIGNRANGDPGGNPCGAGNWRNWKPGGSGGVRRRRAPGRPRVPRQLAAAGRPRAGVRGNPIIPTRGNRKIPTHHGEGASDGSGRPIDNGA